MSRKHNSKHDRRGPSLYPERLAARGESSVSVRMPFIDRGGRKHDTVAGLTRADQRRADEEGRS